MENIFDGFSRLEQPQERHKVVISRHWDNPQITVSVNKDKIEVFSDIDDFITALLEELGSPTLILTRNQLKQKLRLATVKVIEKTKLTTAQVM